MKGFGVEEVTTYKAVKSVFKLVYEGDIIIFAGPQLCEEAYEQNDRMGNIYLYDYSIATLALSMGLGIVMTSDKRVFVICDDYVISRSIDQLLQCGASRHANLYVGMVISEYLHYSNYFPSILSNISEGRTFLSGLGFDSYTLNIDIESIDRDKNALETVKETFYRLSGPIGFNIFVNHSKRTLDYKDEIYKLNLKNRVGTILKDKELVLPKFEIPIEIDSINSEIKFDGPTAIQEMEDFVLPGGF